jgi:hypothetical protein
MIDDVFPAEPKFAKGADDFDICIHIVNVEDEAQSDWWRGEVSQNYGTGNFKSMTQAEITMKTLRNVGFEGDDLTTLAEQIGGRTVPGFVKASKPNLEGKTYMNVYLGSGGGNGPKETELLSPEELKRRLTGGGGGAPAATTTTAPAAAAPTTARNPFAKR